MSFPAAFGSDGHHTVQVKQVDEAGNEGVMTAYDFTLDRFAAVPTLTLTNFAVDSDGRMVTNGGQLLVEGPEGRSIFSRLNAGPNASEYGGFAGWGSSSSRPESH